MRGRFSRPERADGHLRFEHGGKVEHAAVFPGRGHSHPFGKISQVFRHGELGVQDDTGDEVGVVRDHGAHEVRAVPCDPAPAITRALRGDEIEDDFVAPAAHSRRA
jgi:hypothetical protein